MPDSPEENQPYSPPPPSVPPPPPAPPPSPEGAPPPAPAATGTTPAFSASPTGAGERLPLGAGAVSASDDKLYCILCHFLSIIIWLWKKDESPAVNLTGKEALNFHLTALLPQFVLWILSPIVGCITVPVSMVAGLGTLILCIIGALKTSDGYFYKYPVNLRLIS